MTSFVFLRFLCLARFVFVPHLLHLSGRAVVLTTVGIIYGYLHGVCVPSVKSSSDVILVDRFVLESTILYIIRLML